LRRNIFEGDARRAEERKPETGSQGERSSSTRNSKKVEFLNPKKAAAAFQHQTTTQSVATRACDKAPESTEVNVSANSLGGVRYQLNRQKRLDRAGGESKDQIRRFCSSNRYRVVSLVGSFSQGFCGETRKLGAAGRRSAIARR